MSNLLEFVKRLSFVRTAGSEEEKKAADMILKEVRKAVEESKNPGASADVMHFTIPDGVVKKCAITVDGKEIPCVPFLRSGNIGKECKLLYLERGSELDFVGIGDLSDTVVLLNQLTDEDTYKRLVEHHAAAFIVHKGKYYFSLEECSLYPRILREHFTRNGVIPGFTIPAADANRLVQENVKSLHLLLEQEDVEKDSQNIVAVIEGTEQKEESIVLTAHYDSVPVGTGSWDNATGAAALLGIFRHFVCNPPKRTLRFIFCGSEELGLLGSKAFVKENEELLEQIKFCFNFDMCGTALGPNDIFVTGKEDLDTFIDQYCKMAGYSARMKSLVHSSDSAPFCDKDIPALGLSRGTSAAEIHTIHDLTPVLSEAAMEKNVEFAIRLVGDIANAAIIPVEKGMSEERRKELDKYFHRDREQEKKA